MPQELPLHMMQLELGNPEDQRLFLYAQSIAITSSITGMRTEHARLRALRAHLHPPPLHFQ